MRDNGLYESRKVGRVLASVEDCIDALMQRLEDCIKKGKERLIKVANNSISIISIGRKTTKTKKQKWEEKQLYGYFKQQPDEIARKKIWIWQRKRILKRETEPLLISVQNNAIRINFDEVKIDCTQQNSKCRLCEGRDEMLNHIVSECNKPTEKECSTRHDWVGKVIH